MLESGSIQGSEATAKHKSHAPFAAVTSGKADPIGGHMQGMSRGDQHILGVYVYPLWYESMQLHVEDMCHAVGISGGSSITP